MTDPPLTMNIDFADMNASFQEGKRLINDPVGTKYESKRLKENQGKMAGLLFMFLAVSFSSIVFACWYHYKRKTDSTESNNGEDTESVGKQTDENDESTETSETSEPMIERQILEP